MCFVDQMCVLYIFSGWKKFGKLEIIGSHYAVETRALQFAFKGFITEFWTARIPIPRMLHSLISSLESYMTTMPHNSKIQSVIL